MNENPNLILWEYTALSQIYHHWKRNDELSEKEKKESCFDCTWHPVLCQHVTGNWMVLQCNTFCLLTLRSFCWRMTAILWECTIWLQLWQLWWKRRNFFPGEHLTPIHCLLTWNFIPVLLDEDLHLCLVLQETGLSVQLNIGSSPTKKL